MESPYNLVPFKQSGSYNVLLMREIYKYLYLEKIGQKNTPNLVEN